MTVTKKELANHLWETMGLTQRESMKMVETFFDSMREAIVVDSDLILSGFGRFTVRDKSPRPGRNPKTGQPHEIKARRVVTFHASALFRARCNQDLP
jgi:integration host factor subunit alpha